MAKQHPIAAKLSTWYKENRRDLPWRNSSNPYQIWLSEVILQQTRVDQGMSFYARFIERFETVGKLAEAPESDVMLAWQGLGYYSRARNLQAAAKTIVKEHNGQFPSTYNAIRALKGIGDYTAAAIASIVFNLPHAAVDGNVNRVLSRLFAIQEPVDHPSGKKLITACATEILDQLNPGNHNQAVMELGALICSPRNPKCNSCPVHTHCNAFQNKKQEQYPVKRTKIKVRERFLTYFFIIDDRGNTLVRKRNGKDIWQGLHEFPLCESSTLEEHHSILGTIAPKPSSISPSYVHQLSHQRLHIQFIRQLNSELPLANWENAWVCKVSELGNIAFPRAITRYLESLSDLLHPDYLL